MTWIRSNVARPPAKKRLSEKQTENNRSHWGASHLTTSGSTELVVETSAVNCIKHNRPSRTEHFEHDVLRKTLTKHPTCLRNVCGSIGTSATLGNQTSALHARPPSEK